MKHSKKRIGPVLLAAVMLISQGDMAVAASEGQVGKESSSMASAPQNQIAAWTFDDPNHLLVNNTLNISLPGDGTTLSLDAVTALLPQTMEIRKTGAAQSEKLTVEGYQCPQFIKDPSTGRWPISGAYTFRAVLPSSLSLAAGTELPVIQVVLGKSLLLQGEATSGTHVNGRISGEESKRKKKASTKKLPKVSEWPSYSPITYGQRLSESVLTGGTADVKGRFFWMEANAAPSARDSGKTSYTLVFAPDNNSIYSRVEKKGCKITVQKAVPALTNIQASALSYGESLSQSELSCISNIKGELQWSSPDEIPAVADSQKTLYHAAFIPSDTDNYESIPVDIPVTVQAALPSIVWPEFAKLPYGQSLSQATPVGGSATDLRGNPVNGSFTWESPNVIPSVADSDKTPYMLLFTPEDNLNYISTSANLTVSLQKAEPVVTWPSAAPLTYGQPLSQAVLKGGDATDSAGKPLAGTFTFEQPDTIPAVADSMNTTYTLFFTPDDSENYRSLKTTLTLQVDKAPAVLEWPQASVITYGQTLAESILAGGSTALGTFAWQTSDTCALVENNGYTVVFTPTNLDNYDYTSTVMSSEVIVPVEKRTVDITYGSDQFTYNGEVQTLTASITNKLENDEVNLVQEGNQGTAAGIYSAVPSSLTGASSANYQLPLNPPGKEWNILQKETVLALTTDTPKGIALGNASMTAELTGYVAERLPKGTVTFKNGDLIIASNVKLTNQGGRVTASAHWEEVPAGKYHLTAEYTPAPQDSYKAAPASLSYEVEKIEQNGFTFTTGSSLTKTYGDATFQVLAKGGESESPVSYEITSGTDVVSLNGNTITIQKAGKAVITALKPGNENYLDSFAVMELTVTPRIIDITYGTDEFTYNGKPHELTASLLNKMGSDDVDVVIKGQKETDAGEYTAKVTGLTGLAAGNYQLPKKGLEKGWTIAPKELTIALTATPSEGIQSQEVMLTATLSGYVKNKLPKGRITFKNGGVPIVSNAAIMSQDGHAAAVAAWIPGKSGLQNISAEYVPANQENYEVQSVSIAVNVRKLAE